VCSLRREPSTPLIARKPPADFDGGCEVRREVVQRQADKADELSLSGHLDRPEPISARIEARLNAITEGIGLRTVERAREMLHHHWVGIEARERLFVSGPPPA
jgi:hypothetical protein